jgi:hypothetical protein
MNDGRTLDTDYLVVGAGTLGMAFVDSLIEDPKVDVVMVDRRPGPGGHWLDAYPFVRLHQPSANYGVNSTRLGGDRIERDGPDAGFYERASGEEICGYYDDVMRHHLIASGRVRFLPMTDHLGGGRIRSTLTGDVRDVKVRKRIVNATYTSSRIPATEPPPFEVGAGVRLVPVGELVHVDEPPDGFVVVGAGKTSMDAVCWLLDRGVDPDRLIWVRPQDPWLLARRMFQPLGSVNQAFEGAVRELEAVVETESADDAFELLEGEGLVYRLDPTVQPRIARGATVSPAELEQLRSVERVVRSGYIRRIEPDRIVLDDGEVPTTPGHVHVHCAARGLGIQTPVPIFTDDTITLQCISRGSLSMSAALVGYVETTDRSTEEKARLCPPNALTNTPFDWMRWITLGIETELGWGDAPDLTEWLESSRLNLMKGLDGSDPHVRDLQGRFLTSAFPAIERIHEQGKRATPAEQALLFDPARVPA